MEQKQDPRGALSIHVRCEISDDNIILAEQVGQGIEEEQMPAQIISTAGSSAEMARAASQSSLLGVGVGIDKEGVITLTHFQMPPDQPIMQVSSMGRPQLARAMGSNAARLYKRIPFMEIKYDEVLPDQEKDHSENNPLDHSKVVRIIMEVLNRLPPI